MMKICQGARSKMYLNAVKTFGKPRSHQTSSEHFRCFGHNNNHRPRGTSRNKRKSPLNTRPQPSPETKETTWDLTKLGPASCCVHDRKCHGL